MKAFSTRLSLLTTIFLISNFTTADNNIASTADHKIAPISINNEAPLAMVYQKLEQAKVSYKQDDINAVRENLEAANNFLQNLEVANSAKIKNEASELATEIQTLLEKINLPSNKHENIIARMWYRSEALMEYEIQHLKKSWNDTSRINAAVKHLHGAKLHFNYAEFDLLRVHNPKKSQIEIDNTLSYLTKIEKLKIPNINDKLERVKKDIQTLLKIDERPEKEQAMIDTLKQASISIGKITPNMNPNIQTRSNKIINNINMLKDDIRLLDNRKKYDEILKELNQVEKMLRANK